MVEILEKRWLEEIFQQHKFQYSFRTFCIGIELLAVQLHTYQWIYTYSLL